MHMTLDRYLVLATVLFSSIASHAEWTALTVIGTGSKSITTFNGATYVATYNSGIRKSLTGGAPWTLANTGLPVVPNITPEQVPVQSVGHSITALLCGTESGVFRSTDNGASWVAANAGLPAANGLIYANKFYNFNGVTFVVFTGLGSQNGGGVFRSVDDGVSWIAGFSGLSANMTVYNLAQVGGVLYAATSTSLMRSTDLAQSWAQAGSSNFAVFSIAGIGNQLVALSTFGCQRSTDGGGIWTPASGSNYPTPPVAGCELIAYDGKYFAITKSQLGCYVSLNNGVAWTVNNTGLAPFDVQVQEEFHANATELHIACLFDSYSTPGSSVGVEEVSTTLLPAPFPTSFTDFFQIDLSTLAPGATMLLVDAGGREAVRHSNLPASVQRFERGGLMAGRYHCMLIDPRTGTFRSLGSVIAQ